MAVEVSEMSDTLTFSDFNTTRHDFSNKMETKDRSHVKDGPSCSKKASKLENDDTASTSDTRRLKKQLKRLSRSQLEALVTAKVLKLMDTRTELGQLQRNCLGLQREVKEWKERSNTLGKSCRNVAEAVKETIVRPQRNPQVKKCVRSVNTQAGTSAFLTEQLKIEKDKRCLHNRVPPLPKMITESDSEQKLPPKLKLVVSSISDGIQLFWTLDDGAKLHTAIQAYEIYAYLETSKPPSVNLWKKVGDVKAIPLPIRCTLSQFSKGSKYHFSVRARDVASHFGDYSEIKTVIL
eukprot:GFUD01000566.1.p1 GENE.GFUD01000566.1~~GFUD01000566.1.p1  ORF type:complete len:293 (-),score=43.46 GFUD01000566.1:163-1041(-)